MQAHCGCEISIPKGLKFGTLIVPTCMGVLKLSGNGLYTLPLLPLARAHALARARANFALLIACDAKLLHKSVGHLHMQGM
jgi:hypothetical protein